MSAKRVFNELDAADEHAKRMKRGDAGTLRIASAFTMTATFIPRAIRAFRILRPRIPLKFMALPPKQIVTLVERHEVDVGLLYEQVTISNIQSERLFTTPIICAVPASHKLSKRHVVRAEDAAGEEVISYSRDSYAGQLVQGVLGPHDLSVTIEVNSTAVALSLVALGVGVAIVDGLALTKELECDVCLKPFAPSCTLEPSAIHAIDWPTSPLCRDFIAAVRSVVADQAIQG